MSIYDNPHSVQIDGNFIRYYREGSGEAVVFLHGITTYSFIWRKIVPYFAQEYDVVLVDLLGSGDSDIPLNEDFSLKRQSQIIKSLCEKLGLAQIHLVTHDVGGGIGQIMAVNYPELVLDLTLINSVAYDFWPVQPIIAMRTPIIRQLAMASLDFGMFELIVKRGMFHKENLDEELMALFYKPMQLSLGRKGFLHFAKCLEPKNLIEIEAQIRALKMPVLIIRGDGDVYLDAAICEKLHREIPHSQLVRIESGGHFIQEDEPEKVSRSILSFIKEKHG